MGIIMKITSMKKNRSRDSLIPTPIFMPFLQQIVYDVFLQVQVL